MAKNLGKSKRYTLSKLDPEWREKIFSSIKSKRLRLGVAVLTACGCRPHELERGIIVKFHDGHLDIGIHGSKVNEAMGRGQALRLLRVDTSTPWGCYLMEAALHAGNPLLIRYDAAGISQRLREKSRELWPRRKSLVSAYCYRHYIAKSMKESGEAPDKIASTLGHATDFSQNVYGRAGSGKKCTGKHGVLGAVATNPIRHINKTDRLDRFKVMSPGQNRGF